MNSYKLSEIAAMLQLNYQGATDPVISGAGSVTDAKPGEIVFAEKIEYLENMTGMPAALIVPMDFETDIPAIRCENPRAEFTKVLSYFAVPVDSVIPDGIHPTAVIDPGAIIESDVAIGPFCIIGDGTKIGSGTRLAGHVVIEPNCTIGCNSVFYSHVTIRERTIVGDNVILHSGVVIGSDGFGYHPSATGLVKIPQIGNVVIENDVEIGANSCVDRSTTGTTTVKSGVKLDNLVQIAHNVTVGEHTAISAQSGISGSCSIGKGVVIGGQSGCADHLVVGDGVQIAAKTAVTRDVEAGKTVIGFPEIEIKKGYRIFGLTRRLPELFKRVRDLENLLSKSNKSQE